MKIQFNTDKNIEGTERLEKYVSEEIHSSLRRFAGQIMRLEVHLSDQNAEKSNIDDIQCRIEARLKGLQPVAVTGKGDSKEQAVSDAINKIKSALVKLTGKLRSR